MQKAMKRKRVLSEALVKLWKFTRQKQKIEVQNSKFLWGGNLNSPSIVLEVLSELWQFFLQFFTLSSSFFFHPRLLNISKINCRLRRAKVIEFSLLLSHFLPRFHPRPYLFFRNLWWSQKKFTFFSTRAKCRDFYCNCTLHDNTIIMPES